MPFRFMGLTYQHTQHDIEALLRSSLRCEDTLQDTTDEIRADITITGIQTGKPRRDPRQGYKGQK